MTDDTLAAAPTAKAATQQEAQEPVAWQGVHDQTDLYYTKPLQADVRPLYAAPQPAPAPMGDEVLKEVIKDSNRYRWLRRPLLNAGQGSIQVVMDDRLNGKLDRVIFLADLDSAIDAALAAQGGKT